MKKVITIILFCGIITSLAGCGARQIPDTQSKRETAATAETLVAQNSVSMSFTTEYAYYVEDGKAVITRYFGKGGEAVIPEKISDCAVTGIGEFAFANRPDITAVEIPDSVEEIGNAAFYNTGIAEITGKGVKSIGASSFSNCENLTNVAFPACEKVGSLAFFGSFQISKMVLGKADLSQKMIDNMTFKG